MTIFYINGAFVDETQAALDVRDLAILRGYGAFDFLRTYGGRPFRLRKNIERLRHSCQRIELDFMWSTEEIHTIVLETIQRNAGLSDEFTIRLVVTGGVSSDNITPQGTAALMVMVMPLQQNPDAWYEQGTKVITVNMNRILPDAKTTTYTPAIIAQKRAREQGGIEAIYKTDAGLVLEGTTTNIFAFFGNRLVTPPTNGQILPGITRRSILEIAGDDFDVETRALSYNELLTADEVFITAANKRVVPVIQVDDTTISPAPGDGTRQIMALFDAITGRAADGVDACSG